MLVINVNKKGFMFIETIVMCAILMVILLLIYNGYTSSIAKQKEKLNYNTTAGELKLYYVKKYLMNELGWVCISAENCPQVVSFLGDASYKDLSSEIGDLKNLYKIEKIYLTKCSGEISETGDFGEYLDSLKECDSQYRLVAEFKDVDTSKYSYAWIEYPLVETEEE